MQINSLSKTCFKGNLRFQPLYEEEPLTIYAKNIKEINVGPENYAEGSLKYYKFEVPFKYDNNTILSAYQAALAAPDNVTIDITEAGECFCDMNNEYC